jgi:hypothetical protein
VYGQFTGSVFPSQDSMIEARTYTVTSVSIVAGTLCRQRTFSRQRRSSLILRYLFPRVRLYPSMMTPAILPSLPDGSQRACGPLRCGHPAASRATRNSRLPPPHQNIRYVQDYGLWRLRTLTTDRPPSLAAPKPSNLKIECRGVTTAPVLLGLKG